jgi:bisphosphoglycerate-dependent phosphoglycerate mutase
MDNIKESKSKVVYRGEREYKANMGDKTLTAVQYCEETYPTMMEEYKRIMWDQYEMFCKKQKNYGPGNISVGTNLETSDDIKLSLTGLWFRLNDKVQRLKQLVVMGHNDEVGESVQDTFQDLSVYGIIAQIVQNGKWGK